MDDLDQELARLREAERLMRWCLIYRTVALVAVVGLAGLTLYQIFTGSVRDMLLAIAAQWLVPQLLFQRWDEYLRELEVLLDDNGREA